MDGLSAACPPPADFTAQDVGRLIHEHHALMRLYAGTQLRCADLLARQAEDIAVLRARAIRQQAAIVVRDTALAWAREDRAALEAAVPGLPRRAALGRRIESLVGRVRELMHERLHRQARPAAAPGARPKALPADTPELAALEQSLVAADLVICQTGCLSHGAYWRVQDHCRRTGKACVLVAQPDALRIVRIRAGQPS